MSDLPSPGGREDDFLSDSQLTENLLSLFDDTPGANILVDRAKFFTSFLNLTGMFTLGFMPTLQGHVGVDHVALQVLMERFHRDAFGVKRFLSNIERVSESEISPMGKLTVSREVKKLGVRINTSSPRLTKVAAAFSLWMSVMRPVHVTMSGIHAPHVTREDIQQFCGSLNFWIASSYLSMFGDITVLRDPDADVRLGRIPYDLTYRGLNLSSLEMLYCSIFRAKSSGEK